MKLRKQFVAFLAVAALVLSPVAANAGGRGGGGGGGSTPPAEGCDTKGCKSLITVGDVTVVVTANRLLNVLEKSALVVVVNNVLSNNQDCMETGPGDQACAGLIAVEIDDVLSDNELNFLNFTYYGNCVWKGMGKACK